MLGTIAFVRFCLTSRGALSLIDSYDAMLPADSSVQTTLGNLLNLQCMGDQQQCMTGFVWDAAVERCVTCGSGYSTSVGSKFCVACAPGTMRQAGSFLGCQPCAAGRGGGGGAGGEALI